MIVTTLWSILITLTSSERSITIIGTIVLERGTNSPWSLSKVVNDQENERDFPNNLLLVIWSITRYDNVLSKGTHLEAELLFALWQVLRPVSSIRLSILKQ